MNTFEAHILEPQGNASRPETLGLYSLPFAANMQNSGDRLQTMVDEVGFPFVVSDLALQTKATIFDMAARTANAPSGETYQTMSQRRTDFFQEVAAEYQATTRIGVGDSLGVPIIQGMELFGTKDGLFQALLLRDGWNLKRETNILSGLLRYASYMVKDTVQGRIHNKPSNVIDHQWSETVPTAPDETSLLQKMINVSDLMGGSETRGNAVQLAQRAALSGIVLNIVVFDKGLCGNRAEQQSFISEVTAAHDEAAIDNKRTLRAMIADGWHSDLLDPARGAHDVQQTLELLGQ